MEINGDVKKTMTMDLGSLLDAGDGAVVTLVAGDTHLVAHRAVLAARSPVFAAMLSDNSLESSSGQVRIPDVEGPVLRQLLAYCYTLQAPQLPDMALQLLVAADKYRVPVLKAECEKQVAAQLSVETAAAAAVTTIRHSCTVLKETAIAYMKTHLVEVMATQGWADIVRTQTEDVVQLSRLLAETSVPAPAIGGTSSTPTNQPHSDHSDCNQTTSSAAPPMAASRHSPPPDEIAVPHRSAPAPANGGSSPATQVHSDQGDPSSNPASAAPPMAASCHTPQPDNAAVFRLRSLSPEEKNRKLIKAAKQGAVGQLEALLAARADVGARDDWGRTALHWAAIEGHEEAARRLLAAGAAVDHRDRWEETALHWAARSGHAAVVRLLLVTGAAHAARTECGWTALHWAAARGQREAAAALLKGGAERGAGDKRGYTPRHIARLYNQHHLMDLLPRS